MTEPSLADRLTRALLDERMKAALEAEGFNQPTGSLGSGPPNMPAYSQGPIDDPERGASAATIARASLAPAPDDQIRRFAAARFPHLPLDVAVKRYGVDPEGNIVFSDPGTGQLTREVPTIGRGDGWIDKAGRALYQAASGAGPAIPAVAGGVAGMLAGPTGASIPLAGAAAGAADVGRQAVDRYFAGEDPGKIDWGNVAGQAALNAAGQGLGVGISKMLQRNPLGVQAYDRLAAKDPAEQAKWSELYAEAKRRGVDLSVGETSNLRSIRSQERALRTLPETTDKFDDFIRTRNTQQVPAAVRSELDRLAPAQNVAEGAGLLKQGADDVISGMTKQRSAAASPLYQSAFASGTEPDIRPVLQAVGERMKVTGDATPAGKALKAVYLALTEEGPDGVRVPIKNYEKLHSIKESFDDIVQSAFQGDMTSAGKRAGRSMMDVQSTLRSILKDAHPDYRAGAEIFSRMSIPINDARNGALKALLDKEGPAPIRYAEALFDAAKDIPPTEIAKIRQLYNAAGKQPEWNAGVRAFLADRLDTALGMNAGGEAGGVPGKFVKSVWGTGNQKDIMKAALGDQQLVTSFEKLMDVLQAAARSLPEGSPTAANLAAQQGMMQPGKMAKFVGKATSPGTLLTLGSDVAEGISSLRRPAQRIALAEHLLSEDGMKLLRKMTMLSPTSEKAITLTGQLLSDAGIVTGLRSAGIGVPAPRLPEEMGTLP